MIIEVYYITGESDHGMGMKVQGNDSNIWNFRFACSFSYSIIEQMVGTFIWNNTEIGTVTSVSYTHLTLPTT